VIDLERQIKQTLERRAEEAVDRTGGGIPDELFRRVRRRQARTVLLSGLLIGAVGVSALAGVRPWLGPPGREPASERTGSPPPPGLTEQARKVVATGESGGDRWRLIAGKDEGVWCVAMETVVGDTVLASSTCGDDLLQGRHVVANTDNRPNFDVVLVSGAVSHQIDRVVFDRDTGPDVEGRIYPLPERRTGPFDAFVIAIPKDRPVGGAVLAFDSNGDVLEQQGFHAESVLTQGHFRGHPWMLLHNRQHECLEALSGGIRYSVCNTRVPDRSFMEWTTIGMPADRENLLFGFVRADTVRLVVEVAGGRQAEARVLPLPWDAKAKAFFVEIDGHRGELVAIDAIGEEIRAEPFRLIPFSEG
jgi:hypothetical protein